MDQLAQVLVFGSDDEFINLLDHGAYNMNLGNAYTQGLLPLVGAILFQTDARNVNMGFMISLSNLIPFGTTPDSLQIYNKLDILSQSYQRVVHIRRIIGRLIAVLNSIQQIV